MGGRHGNHRERNTSPRAEHVPPRACLGCESGGGAQRLGVQTREGWSAKAGADVGGCKEPVFYFLIACHSWPGNLLVPSQGWWAPTPARKCCHLLELGFIWDNCSMSRKWIEGLCCLCQFRIHFSVCNLLFCESFPGVEYSQYKLVSGRTSKHWQTSFRVVMKSGFVQLWKEILMKSFAK